MHNAYWAVVPEAARAAPRHVPADRLNPTFRGAIERGDHEAAERPCLDRSSSGPLGLHGGEDFTESRGCASPIAARIVGRPVGVIRGNGRPEGSSQAGRLPGWGAGRTVLGGAWNLRASAAGRRELVDSRRSPLVLGAARSVTTTAASAGAASSRGARPSLTAAGVGARGAAARRVPGSHSRDFPARAPWGPSVHRVRPLPSPAHRLGVPNRDPRAQRVTCADDVRSSDLPERAPVACRVVLRPRGRARDERAPPPRRRGPPSIRVSL